MGDSLDYQFFIQYFNKFKKFEPKAFDLALEHAYNHASVNGLSENDLILITKVSFSQPLGVSRMRKLIKTLIPRSSVPNEAIEYVMEWILVNVRKDVSLFSKKILLQWLIGLITYQLVDPFKTINCYYDFMWYFLKEQIIDVQACHLIYLLAKVEDVNRWYVKQLLKEHKKKNYSKYTGALLLLFKSYRPECVPEDIPANPVHKAFGVLPNYIDTNFSKARERLKHDKLIPREINNICWFTDTTKIGKKSAIQLIPNIVESEMNNINGLQPLTSFTNTAGLCKYLIQRNSPNKALSLLSNSEGMLVLIFGDVMLHERFSFHLYYMLFDAFLERNPLISYSEKANFLDKLNILQNQMKQGIPVVSKFLALFIITWDGIEYENSIYGLLEWLNFKSYNELNECILNFIYDLFICGTVEVKCKILTMLGHLSVNIIMTYFYRIKNKNPFLFLAETVKWNFYDVIFKLYEYVTNLCKLAWYFDKGHSLIIQTIIDVNYMIMCAEESCALKIWILPQFLCYSALFSCDPSVLLRICRLFNRFPLYVNEIIKKDFLESLIYNIPFNGKEKDSIFKIFSEHDTEQLEKLLITINTSLSFEKHAALACFNYDFNSEEKNDENRIEEFMKFAKIHYPDLINFIANNS